MSEYQACQRDDIVHRICKSPVLLVVWLQVDADELMITDHTFESDPVRAPLSQLLSHEATSSNVKKIGPTQVNGAVFDSAQCEQGVG